MANSKEKLESNEVKKWKITNTDLKKYVGEYFESSINWDLSYFDNNKNFFDDFCRYFRVKWDKELVEKIKNSLNDKKLMDLFNEEINLKSIWINDFLLKLEKVSFKEYSLDIEENNKLKKSFLNKNLSFLNRLLRSEKSRNQYLLDEKILSKEDLEQKINWISKSDEQVLQKIFNWNQNLVDKVIADKDLQFAIFSIYSLNERVNFNQLKKVLGEFDNEWKKALIKYFLPVISLSNAEKTWLITKKEVETELKEIARLNDIEWEGNINNFIKKIDRTSIFIDTSSLSFLWFKFDKISDKVFEEITHEINDAKNYVDKVDILWIDDFKKFCKDSKELNDGLKEEINSNFSVWNYLTITKKDESWNDKTFYFYIKNTSTTWVELVNVTKLNWISSSNTWPLKFHTYQDLFNLLNKSQSSNAFVSIKTNESIQNDDELTKIPEKNEIKSRKDLENALNELDPKWAWVTLEKMAFKFPKGKNDKDNVFDENFFSVTYNQVDNSIKLDNWQVFAWDDLSIFLDAFEVNKCTRFERIDTAKEFLDKMWESSEAFKDIIFDDWKLVPKDQKWHKDYPGINLLIWKDQKKDQTIRIDKIEDGNVSFSMWEYKEWNKEKNEPNIFKADKKAKNWSYTDFFMLIKKRNLTPKKQKVEEQHDEHHGAHLHKHGSLFTSWMSNFWSITEIIKWAEQMIHAVQHNLETWNKVKAAKAALFFWKILPHHLQVELQSEVENSEKETMEKIKKELTWVDSKVMFPMIEHILQNSSAPQYEVEAAMFATLKYGSLYPKDLAKYRWSYLWFEKLWWHKNMIPKLTQEMLKDDPDLVITEEVLINALLAQQAMGLIKPKRRSKIHKEFWATIQEWLNKEAWDWERETWLRMTADWRITYIMWEFKWSTFANGIWWMENVWAKWPDPAWKMNTIPFVIMASGLSLDLHQSLINKLKKFWCTTPYNSLVLCASKSWVELYQKYLDKVIEIYSWWKNTKMYEAFQKAKKWSDSWKISLSMKDFWDKYWEELYPVINMNDGYVISQKDKEWNEILKKYWEKISWLHNSLDFSPKNDQIDDWFYSAENSPFAQSWALLYKIVPKDRGYLDGTGKMVLRSHMDYIKNVLQNDNPEIKDEDKKEIFKESYKKLERHVYNKMVAYRPKDINMWEKWYWWFEIYMEMKKKWFDIYDVQLKNPDDPKEVDKFNDEYDKFLESEWIKFKNKSHSEDENEVFWEKLKVEQTVDEILDFWSSANNENYKNVA